MQASSRSRSGRCYPRHSPLVGEATEEGSYTLRCLACGVKGPEREDTLKAKLAFDEIFVANDCYSPTFREEEFSEVRPEDKWVAATWVFRSTEARCLAATWLSAADPLRPLAQRPRSSCPWD
jgi:hypothetical protein